MASKNVLIWRDPPARRTRTGVWEERLAPLIEQPEQWALIRICDTYKQAGGCAGSLKSGKLRMPPGRWEVCARTLDDGTGGVFIRWLGLELDMRLVDPAPAASSRARARAPRKRAAAA